MSGGDRARDEHAPGALRTTDLATSRGLLRYRWCEARAAAAGPTVVLVHGIPTSPALWRRVVPLLDGVGQVVVPELVGYGGSAPQARRHDVSVAAQAGYLLDLLAALGVERAVLVGHDIGGAVVQVAAVSRPELCAGLVLTNAAAFDSWPVPGVQRLQRAAPLVRLLPAPLVRRQLRQVWRAGHATVEEREEADRVHWPPYARHGAARTLVRQAVALDGEDTRTASPALAGLRVPAAVVWGDADRFQPLAVGERLAAVLGIDVQRLPGGRHFTPEEFPAAVADAVVGVAAAAEAA